MIETIIHFAEEHLYLHVFLITLAAGFVVVAMGIDMFYGMKKSKEIGQKITSRKMGGTLKKARDYFSVYVCLSFLDVLSSFIVPIPFFCLVGAGVCIFREIKSIRESAWEKQLIHEFDRTIKIAATDKTDLAKLLVDIMGGDKDTQTAPQQAVHDGERTINLSASDKADIAKLLADLLNGGNSSPEGGAPTEGESE